VQFREGATVLGSDGEEVGRVGRIVVDPRTKEVTHLVIENGALFKEEKVVPMDLVGPATSEVVTLWEEASDLGGQPDFEESHYVPAETGPHATENSSPSSRSLYPYPPFVLPRLEANSRADDMPHIVQREERNIPDGTVALEAGASAIASDGEKVGTVEQTLVDSQTEKITHFVISDGVLNKSAKLIPIAWLDRVREDEVRLAVDSAVIERLPEYDNGD
jgi:sporulation protein YlmC with PRC-barrel domain